MKQTTDVMNKNHGLSPKEVSIMNKSNLHNKRLQSLNKGKTKSLGPVEKITMTYAGRIDGKKNLLRCNENGIWQSSTLKQEVDSYEEFCAEQMGKLKLQEEDEFKKLNILFDQVIPLRKKLLESKNLLRNAMDIPVFYCVACPLNIEICLLCGKTEILIILTKTIDHKLPGIIIISSERNHVLERR